VNPNTITSVRLAASGIPLCGPQESIYVLVPTVIAAMTGGIYSAWLVPTKLTK
jgi:hypothetical protein